MRSALMFAGRLLLGGVFIYAAYTKLAQHWTLFAFSINSYGIFPEWTLKPIAILLPWVELGLGLLLVFGLWLRYAAAAVSILLLAFFGIMLRAYLQGQDIDCGCFGLGEALSIKTLVRDGLLLGLSLALTVGAFLNRSSGVPGRARSSVSNS
jgi:uncharacterized membrane protein YphA (DoxX/SURF4 family)